MMTRGQEIRISCPLYCIQRLTAFYCTSCRLFSPPAGRKALSYCQPQRGGGGKVLLLLSHKKVTKRLWTAASYGKIGVVGYRLLQERDG